MIIYFSLFVVRNELFDLHRFVLLLIMIFYSNDGPALYHLIMTYYFIKKFTRDVNTLQFLVTLAFADISRM